MTLTDDRVADGMDSLRALEPRGSDLRDLLAMVSSYVCSTVDDISNASASQYRDVAEVLRDAKLRGHPPLAGRPLDDVLHDVGRAASIGVNPASPGCLAYVPGSGLVSAALRRVNAEQHVFLSSTHIDGRYVGRLSVLNHRTDRSRVLEATGALRRHAATVVQELS